MSLTQCDDCGHSISKKAKSCPKCGAPTPNKGSFLHTFLAIVIVLAVLIAVIPDQEKTPMSDNELKVREHVVNLFKGEQEPSVKDALWTSDTMLSIGVYNDGTSKHGFAEYVCSVLDEYSFKGRGIRVKVIDYGKLMQDGKWITLGKTDCL